MTHFVSSVSNWFSEILYFFFSSRRRHTRLVSDWSSDVCSSDLFGHAINGWSSAVLDSKILAFDPTKLAQSFQELLKDRTGGVLGSNDRRVGKECRSRWSRYH